MVPEILVLMSSDNVAQSMIAAMLLQFVLYENRASHSRQSKGTHLKSAAIFTLHAIIDLSHLDRLTRLRISFAIAMQVVGGFISG